MNLKSVIPSRYCFIPIIQSQINRKHRSEQVDIDSHHMARVKFFWLHEKREFNPFCAPALPYRSCARALSRRTPGCGAGGRCLNHPGICHIDPRWLTQTASVNASDSGASVSNQLRAATPAIGDAAINGVSHGLLITVSSTGRRERNLKISGPQRCRELQHAGWGIPSPPRVLRS